MIAYPSQLLDAQLDVLDQQADLDRWKNDRELSMLGYNMESLIALELETLNRIRKLPPSLGAAVVLGYFRRWHEVALRVLACAEYVEGGGVEVESSDAFRFAINEAGIALNFDRVLAAQDRLNAGIGGTLDEKADGPQV